MVFIPTLATSLLVTLGSLIGGDPTLAPAPSFASVLQLPDNVVDRRQTFVGLVDRVTTAVVVGSVPAIVVASSPASATDSSPQRLEFRTIDPTTGLMVADIRCGQNDSSQPLPAAAPAVVQSNSKVNVHITGRLLGKNGWIFENSQVDGEPYRLQLGTNSIVPGLELGLLGMAEGGIRRIVVPSELGYRPSGTSTTPSNKQTSSSPSALEPIPRDFGNRQRLYTTVLNSGRIDREKSQLGTDLAGKVVFDVELLRIR